LGGDWKRLRSTVPHDIHLASHARARSDPGKMVGSEEALHPQLSAGATRLHCGTPHFSFTPNRARHPLGVLLRTFDQSRSLCPRATQTVTGDSEKSRSRSVGDKPSQTREQTMKIASVVALVGLAVNFALPTFAQQTNTATRLSTHLDWSIRFSRLRWAASTAS
jgi:hypothetical protein